MDEKIRARVEKIDYFGKGIVRVNDMVVFVKGVLQGEEVDIVIVNKKKKYAEGLIKEMVSNSPNRVEGLCAFSSKCGGCDLIHLKYEEQLKYKEEKIKELFSRNFDYDILVNSIISTSNLNYRNKITLHVNNNKLGLYEERSNNVIEISKCNITNSYINAVIPRIRELLENFKCNLNTVVIKCNLKGDILLSMFGKVSKNTVLDFFSDINTIYLNNKLIKGSGFIEENINGYNFQISNKSFFQVNTIGAKLLYDEVIRHVKSSKGNKALDLYCGTGTISMLISKYVDEVIGVEVEKDAFKDANESIKLNNIKNVKFINDKVENCIENFSNIDMIIVDPPREGLTKQALEDIAGISPKKIIYVSCDAITLIRDLKMLNEKYRVIEVTPVDMFSNTHHVECVCRLTIK